MSILLITEKATDEQVEAMLESLEMYIKLAVDIERGILVGGGKLHSDCEEVLLENGSVQENVWGADWIPSARAVTFESLINIRLRQNNFKLEVESAVLRDKIEAVIRRLLEIDDEKS